METLVVYILIWVLGEEPKSKGWPSKVACDVERVRMIEDPKVEMVSDCVKLTLRYRKDLL